MFLRPMKWAALCVAAMISVETASAEVVMSQSNNPRIAIDAQVSGLMGTEREALTSVRATRFQQLVKPPVTSRGRGPARSAL
jgi:hypothetical protein